MLCEWMNKLFLTCVIFPVVGLPDAVPARYTALRDVSLPAIRTRLRLLHHFSDLIYSSWRLLNLNPAQVGVQLSLQLVKIARTNTFYSSFIMQLRKSLQLKSLIPVQSAERDPFLSSVHIWNVLPEYNLTLGKWLPFRKRLLLITCMIAQFNPRRAQFNPRRLFFITLGGDHHAWTDQTSLTGIGR